MDGCGVDSDCRALGVGLDVGSDTVGKVDGTKGVSEIEVGREFSVGVDGDDGDDVSSITGFCTSASDSVGGTDKSGCEVPATAVGVLDEFLSVRAPVG